MRKENLLTIYLLLGKGTMKYRSQNNPLFVQHHHPFFAELKGWWRDSSNTDTSSQNDEEKQRASGVNEYLPKASASSSRFHSSRL